MFREMRRKRQELPKEDSNAVLRRGSTGVPGIAGGDGDPQCPTTSYVYEKGKI